MFLEAMNFYCSLVQDEDILWIEFNWQLLRNTVYCYYYTGAVTAFGGKLFPLIVLSISSVAEVKKTIATMINWEGGEREGRRPTNIMFLLRELEDSEKYERASKCSARRVGFFFKEYWSFWS